MSSTRQMCRLCLSEESLVDAYEDVSLRQWISDFLCIKISAKDRISRVICVICRIRVAEICQFREQCQEVQGVLQSIVRNGNVDENKEQSPPQKAKKSSKRGVTVAISQCFDKQSVENGGQTIPEGNDKSTLRKTRNTHHHDVRAINANHMAVDIIDVGEVKIEDTETRRKKKPRKYRILECRICFKVFKYKQLLSNHKRIVHGPKNYQCEMCGVRFPLRNLLTTHELTKRHLARLQNSLNPPVETTD